MEGDRLLKAREVFAAALDRRGAERDAYLAAACGDDAGLRQHVTSLLDAHERAGNFLAGATLSPGDLSPAPAGTIEGPGTVVGPYKILQLIGEGGFVSVFMAEQ